MSKEEQDKPSADEKKRLYDELKKEWGGTDDPLLKAMWAMGKALFKAFLVPAECTVPGPEPTAREAPPSCSGFNIRPGNHVSGLIALQEAAASLGPVYFLETVVQFHRQYCLLCKRSGFCTFRKALWGEMNPNTLKIMCQRVPLDGLIPVWPRAPGESEVERLPSVDRLVHAVLDAPGVLYDSEHSFWFGIREDVLRHDLRTALDPALAPESE